MSLLDQILDGPRVVHDEHDTDNVAVAEGDVATALYGAADDVKQTALGRALVLTA